MFRLGTSSQTTPTKAYADSLLGPSVVAQQLATLSVSLPVHETISQLKHAIAAPIVPLTAALPIPSMPDGCACQIR